MPKLLAKYRARVEDLKNVASAATLSGKKQKVVDSTIKSYFNTNYESRLQKS